jgi:hypothetical protein
MMGKTANGTATEGISRETGTLFSMVATWTLSTKKGRRAWDTNDEAILFCTHLGKGPAVNCKIQNLKKKR